MAKKIGGYVAVSNQDKYSVQEEFRGEVFDKETTFPKGLGAQHPFNFEDLEYLNFYLNNPKNQ
ncbi:MAG: hypothetical protein IH819_00770, partial [Bacteroidetes bacterium]|nr:hypothetical protein [Bacteroidota bacterium]